MDPFILGLIVLLVCAIVFYIVLFSFIFYWHLKKITFIVVPLIFTFEFMVMGFFAVAMVSIVIHYIPILIGSLGI